MSSPVRISMGVADNEPIRMGVKTQQRIPMGSSSTVIFGGDKTFVYHQNQASDRWEIQHNLRKYPSVSVVDTAGTSVVGDVEYIDENNVVCTFNAAFLGEAYLN